MHLRGDCCYQLIVNVEKKQVKLKISLEIVCALAWCEVRRGAQRRNVNRVRLTSRYKAWQWGCASGLDYASLADLHS